MPRTLQKVFDFRNFCSTKRRLTQFVRVPPYEILVFHRNTQIRNRGGTMCPPLVLIGLMPSNISNAILKICCKMLPPYVMVILYSEQSALRYIQVKLDINGHCWQKSKSVCSMLCLCLLFNKVILIALLVTR